jgi:hypothetical protein
LGAYFERVDYPDSRNVKNEKLCKIVQKSRQILLCSKGKFLWSNEKSEKRGEK